MPIKRDAMPIKRDAMPMGARRYADEKGPHLAGLGRDAMPMKKARTWRALGATLCHREAIRGQSYKVAACHTASD